MDSYSAWAEYTSKFSLYLIELGDVLKDIRRIDCIKTMIGEWQVYTVIDRYWKILYCTLGRRLNIHRTYIEAPLLQLSRLPSISCAKLKQLRPFWK